MQKENLFKCNAKGKSEFCGIFLKTCVGETNCKLANCMYCANKSLDLSVQTVCNECNRFDLKKEMLEK